MLKGSWVGFVHFTSLMIYLSNMFFIIILISNGYTICIWILDNQTFWTFVHSSHCSIKAAIFYYNEQYYWCVGWCVGTPKSVPWWAKLVMCRLRFGESQMSAMVIDTSGVEAEVRGFAKECHDEQHLWHVGQDVVSPKWVPWWVTLVVCRLRSEESQMGTMMSDTSGVRPRYGKSQTSTTEVCRLRCECVSRGVGISN